MQVTGGKALLKVTPPADAISLTPERQRRRRLHRAGACSPATRPPAASSTWSRRARASSKVGDTARSRSPRPKRRPTSTTRSSRAAGWSSPTSPRSPDIALHRHAAHGAQRPAARLPDPAQHRGGGRLPALRRRGRLPAEVQVGLRPRTRSSPGDQVEVNVQTEGAARVGLAAVDRSVFILAENRLNLQQVFAELERLYLKPQAELHEARPLDKMHRPGRQGHLPGRRRGRAEQQDRCPQGKEYENATSKCGCAGGMRRTAAQPAAAPPGCHGRPRRPAAAADSLRDGDAAPAGWPRCSGCASSSPRPGSGTR